MEKTPKELYQERLTRVEDAIQVKVPDRVPIVPIGDYFPGKYSRTNLTRYIVMVENPDPFHTTTWGIFF